jgi:hypothetical protein
MSDSKETPKMFTCCPYCGAAHDFDSDNGRHYECGTRGDTNTGVYVKRCEEKKA